MASKVKKKYVIAKMGKFATVGGGLGSRPKVYATTAAAQFDLNTNVKLKGGLIQPYVDPNADVPTPPLTATTSKAKAKAGTTQTAKPKKAAAGM